MKAKLAYELFPAPVTPFTEDDHINFPALELLLRRNLAEGADGFFVGGSSGECFLLEDAERVALLEAASGFVGKCRMIAHAGAVSTRTASRLAKEAKRLRYDLIAATPPFYYKFSAKDICRYFYDLSSAAQAPVLLYNFPANTGVELDLTNRDYRDLLKSHAIYGLKHTNLNLFQMERLQELNPSLKIYNGYDETLVSGMAMGAVGSIGSTFSFMLPHYREIVRMSLQANAHGALQLQKRANNIMQALCQAGLISSIKYVLKTQGVDAGPPRLPFVPVTKEQADVIDKVIGENLYAQ